MGWKESDAVVSTEFVSISEDGQKERVLVVGQPVPYEATMRRKTITRIGFPVIYSGELKVLSVSKTTYPQVKMLRAKLKDHALEITRSGARGDTETTYSVEALPMDEEEQKQFAEVDKKKVAELMENLAIPF